MKVFEWLASLLVVIGVGLMIGGRDLDGASQFVVYLLGVAVLTFGIRLAIDAAKDGDQ